MKKIFTLILLASTSILFSQEFSMDLVKNITPRNIGPGGMSGRVTSIDVVNSNPDIMYVGTAVPTYIISGFEFTTSIEVTRPLIPPGPIFLGVMFLTKSIENSWENRIEVEANNISVKIFFISII